MTQFNPSVQADLPAEQAGRMPYFQRLVCGPWLDWIIHGLCALAMFATVLQMLRAATTLGEPLRIGISLAFALVAIGAVQVLSRTRGGGPFRLLSALGAVPLWVSVVLGLVLRIVWISVFPAEAGSDARAYLSLAHKLVEGLPYETMGLKAYWPVGYPLFLAGWIALLDQSPLDYLASNLFVFVLGALGVAYLARTLAGVAAGRIAALLFALWPNLVFSAATPEKEMLVLALLPWATALLLRVLKGDATGWGGALVAGLLIGAGTLVQPSLQFLPFVAAILLIGLSVSWRSGVVRSVLVVFGAALVVAPWTLRNYEVFDHVVLVSSNGGFNLYRANNPLATGGYTEEGEQDLSALGELERDAVARKLAVDWIRSNPDRFAALMVEKQIRFMGDDAVGVYTTLKVGKASDDPRAYALLKAFSNAWWLAAWVALAALAVMARRHAAVIAPLGRAPIWLWLYLFALHSVFESAGKYHVPVLWVPCVLLAVYAVAAMPGRST